jgi:hypothetical protein
LRISANSLGKKKHSVNLFGGIILKQNGLNATSSIWRLIVFHGDNIQRRNNSDKKIIIFRYYGANKARGIGEKQGC